MKTLNIFRTFFFLLLICGNAGSFAAFQEQHSARIGQDDYKKIVDFIATAARKFENSNRQSFLFAVKVDIDARGRCRNVGFSDTTPEALKTSLKNISDLHVSWLSLIKNPDKRNHSLVIPVLIAVEMNNGQVYFGAVNKWLYGMFTFSGEDLFDGGKLDGVRILSPVHYRSYGENFNESPVVPDDLRK